MAKLSLLLLRSLYKRSSTCLRSARFNEEQSLLSHGLLRRSVHSRSLFSLSPNSLFSLSPNSITRRVSSSDCRPHFSVGVGSIRSFSEDMSHLPVIRDPEIENVFKDLMAASWDELPDPVIKDAKKALSKNTEDKAGQEALANIFRAAEACEEFSGILVSLRMAIDDLIGMSGENVQAMPDEYANALREVHTRYNAYLDAFGPEEMYLKKKVETELGTRMIHLKLRCSGLGADWGKVTLLGTSGLSGSYVEQRAR